MLKLHKNTLLAICSRSVCDGRFSLERAVNGYTYRWSVRKQKNTKYRNIIRQGIQIYQIAYAYTNNLYICSRAKTETTYYKYFIILSKNYCKIICRVGQRALLVGRTDGGWGGVCYFVLASATCLMLLLPSLLYFVNCCCTNAAVLFCSV